MRRTPLQVMFSSVKVTSRADGVLRVTPKWRCDGGGPGLLINAHLKKGKA